MSTLSPETVPLVSGQEDVERGLVGEGDAVPGVLHTGDRSSSLQECDCLGPKLQLRPLHGFGIPLQRHPDGTRRLFWAVHTDPSLTPNHPYEGGLTI